MTSSIRSMLQLLQQLVLFHLGCVEYKHGCPVAAKQTQLVLFWHHAAQRTFSCSRPSESPFEVQCLLSRMTLPSPSSTGLVHYRQKCGELHCRDSVREDPFDTPRVLRGERQFSFRNPTVLQNRSAKGGGTSISHWESCILECSAIQALSWGRSTYAFCAQHFCHLA